MQPRSLPTRPRPAGNAGGALNGEETDQKIATRTASIWGLVLLFLKPTKSELPLAFPLGVLGQPEGTTLLWGKTKHGGAAGGPRAAFTCEVNTLQHQDLPTALSQVGLTGEVWQGRGWGTSVL